MQAAHRYIKYGVLSGAEGLSIAICKRVGTDLLQPADILLWLGLGLGLVQVQSILQQSY